MTRLPGLTRSAPATPLDRERQPNLLDQLLVGDGAAAVPQYPLDDLGLVGVEPAAQGGDDGLDVRGPRLSRYLGRRLALDAMWCECGARLCRLAKYIA